MRLIEAAGRFHMREEREEGYTIKQAIAPHRDLHTLLTRFLNLSGTTKKMASLTLKAPSKSAVVIATR